MTAPPLPQPTAHRPGGVPSPAGHPVWGHLGRWGTQPLALLKEGAELGPVFALRLPRRTALVGYSPEWNRFVLRDGKTFRARHSVAQLVPHLSGGIVLTDEPEHRRRRAVLDGPFRSMEGMRDVVRAAVAPLVPTGTFDTLEWATAVVPVMLNAALFGGSFPPDLLRRYLHPLEQGMPAALVPRPLSRRRVRAELARQVQRRRGLDAADLAGLLRDVEGAAEELRVALAAGFDTSAHTLAWALWYLAAHPQWQAPDLRARALEETLRLHPAGFIGSRRAAADTAFQEIPIPAGTLVFYSPLLTHHSPDLWDDPEVFDPSRFDRGIRGWTYIPFSAGQRTCLGAHLANVMLTEAIDAVLARPLQALEGDPTPRAAVTIVPTGPLRVRR